MTWHDELLAGAANSSDPLPFFSCARILGAELVPKKRLVYDALVAVGTRMVTMRPNKGVEVMDCTPACYPPPFYKPKEPRDPDQVIENRNR